MKAFTPSMREYIMHIRAIRSLGLLLVAIGWVATHNQFLDVAALASVAVDLAACEHHRGVSRAWVVGVQLAAERCGRVGEHHILVHVKYCDLQYIQALVGHNFSW